VFLTARTHVEHNILDSSRLAEPLKSATPSGWGGAWIPIRTTDAIVGVLFVALQLPRRVASEQTRLLTSLAEMAGGIIQRLRLFQQTQAQAELTRQIVNTVPEGLALVDDSGSILLANPAAESLLSVLGGERQHDVLVALGSHPLQEVLAQTQGWQEIEHEGRIFALNVRPVEPERPQTSWVLVVNEITKEREHQRYQEVQDRLATVGQLAAGLAHDFNNVLGVISVYADILLMAPNLLPKQKQQLSTIVDQTHHAANLVRQVLDFSRRSVMERQRVDLYPLLNEQVKLLRHTLPENIELHLQMDHAPLVLDADPTRLRQVLMNLAINARDAMPRGGALTFDLTRLQVAHQNGHAAPLPDMAPGEWLRLVVADTGAGIAAAHLPHIFEPFFTTKGPGMGTGLGLAQVYGIVKQHGGAITVASTPGQGTAFTIYLPLTDREARAQAAAGTAKAIGGSEQILLVEDNLDLREALTHSLASLGYRVLPAHDADTALALAETAEGSIDLVLSDLVLPSRNGIELFGALQPLHPAARLVIMTGHPITEARMESLRTADYWIQKPFALDSLTQRVRKLLDER
jgi:signal transduction histidine kinase